jgi:hypothetical protein
MKMQSQCPTPMMQTAVAANLVLQTFVPTNLIRCVALCNLFLKERQMEMLELDNAFLVVIPFNYLFDGDMLNMGDLHVSFLGSWE